MTKSTSDGSEAEKKLWALDAYLDELTRYFLPDARQALSHLQLPITATRGGPQLLGIRGNLRGARHLIDEQLRLVDELFAAHGVDPDKDVPPTEPPILID